MKYFDLLTSIHIQPLSEPLSLLQSSNQKRKYLNMCLYKLWTWRKERVKSHKVNTNTFISFLAKSYWRWKLFPCLSYISLNLFSCFKCELLWFLQAGKHLLTCRFSAQQSSLNLESLPYSLFLTELVLWRSVLCIQRHDVQVLKVKKIT